MEIEEIEKDGKRKVRLKGSMAIDTPKPYTIIFRTTKEKEFESVSLTEPQYKGILAELSTNATGIILNGEYYDRYSIYRVQKPKV